MSDDNFCYNGREQEEERQRRNRERFETELNGWEPPKPPDLRPKDIPFVMCGMCNTYPTHWATGGWRCSKVQASVSASSEACERWTPREDWKVDPLMYVSIHERPTVQAGLRDRFEPLLPPEPEPEVSYVYFIQCGEFVKIGFSTAPKARIASIATSSPQPVEFIGLIIGEMRDERALHRKYKELRHKREWFRLTDELRADIRALCGSERKWRALLRKCV